MDSLKAVTHFDPLPHFKGSTSPYIPPTSEFHYSEII